MGRILVLIWVLTIAPVAANAADLAADQVRDLLLQAKPGAPADLSGKDLSGLDLSGLDFKQANLAGANLFGAKLVGADLSGANLAGARLDAAWIMRANFTKANLSKASMFGPVVYSGLEVRPAEAPTFAGADLSGARIIARLARVNLSGCNCAHAQMGVDMRNQPMGQMRVDLSGSNLDGANFSGADLNRAVLAFAKLRNARLDGANLTSADLSGADLTGADLANADLTAADLNEAILKDVKGLDAAGGLDQARNRNKAIY